MGVPVTIEILFALVLVKFDEHSRSAQTDPAAVALYGVALATLDDDPGVRPDAHAFNSWPADRTRLRFAPPR